MCTGEWGGGSSASAGDLARVAQPLGSAQPRIILASSRMFIAITFCFFSAVNVYAWVYVYSVEPRNGDSMLCVCCMTRASYLVNEFFTRQARDTMDDHMDLDERKGDG